MAAPGLVQEIRAALRAAADPTRAPGMQAYMKSAMPYLGVRVPEVRRVVRGALRAWPPSTPEEVREAADDLWSAARYREERYAAAEVTAAKVASGQLPLLPLYRRMIVEGAWWDHVDAVAHRIGDLLRRHPDVLAPLLRGWSIDQDRWLRRSSIIAQLGAKERTDLALLEAVVTVNAEDREFFVAKAIGWALRDFARTDPVWVLALVERLGDRLRPLSRREAVKHLL